MMRMNLNTLYLGSLALLATLGATDLQAASIETEEQAIRETILDYLEGAYDTDADRFASAMHPELTKRGYVLRQDKIAIVPHTKESLEHNVRYRLKKGWIPEGAVKEIEILDVLGDLASAKCLAHWGVDYLHLVKKDGKWLILHVLWQNNEYISQTKGESS